MESVWLGSPVNPTRPLPSARSQEVVNFPGQREPGTDDHFLAESKKLWFTGKWVCLKIVYP